jgi:hypothetical protein
LNGRLILTRGACFVQFLIQPHNVKIYIRFPVSHRILLRCPMVAHSLRVANVLKTFAGANRRPSFN